MAGARLGGIFQTDPVSVIFTRRLLLIQLSNSHCRQREARKRPSNPFPRYAAPWIDGLLPSSLVELRRKPWSLSSGAQRRKDAASCSRGTMCPRFTYLARPSRIEGAGKAGCTLHPRSRAQCAQRSAHTSIQVQRRHPGLPCAVVYDLLRALLGDRAFLPPSPRGPRPTRLDASVGASGPHDFIVRFSAVRRQHIRVHRIPPRVS